MKYGKCLEGLCKATIFYLLDYILLSGISKCGDLEKLWTWLQNALCVHLSVRIIMSSHEM